MDIRPVVKSLAPGASGIEREAPAATPKSASPSPSATVAAARGVVDPAASAGDDIGRAVDRINAFFSASQGIEFAIDDDSKRVVVKVIDRETREVLRQMPSQEALEIAKALDRTQGMLIKLEA
jgi:flagellar protein FlaG